MRLAIDIGPIGICIDAPAGSRSGVVAVAGGDPGAEVIDALDAALRRLRDVRVARQLPSRVYAYPDRPGEVERLAEGVRVWGERRGLEVVVGRR